MATSTGDVLLAYLGQQLGEMLRHGPGALAGQPEPIHQLRVAARRLRSLLSTGRTLFADGACADIRSELQWISGVLGAARDPTVVRDRLRALLAEELPELVAGPAADRIDRALDASAAAGMKSLTEALDGERYALLLGRLSEFVTAAPQTAEAARGPRETVRKLVARDEARLRRAVNGLAPRPERTPDLAPSTGTGGGPGCRDAGLHEVRKAAKRLRYAAEFATAVAVNGDAKRLSRLAAAARSIQTALGLHQDTVMARALLVELGTPSLPAGESGFSYGRLHAREESLAAAAEADFLRSWRKFPR
ncbi:CHAD domain-containing protein [Arthrobacter sp. NPDC058192]|uniref:CHAD domain-containing protein n=1 Tax=Arthrobacter sp. NPDC058192 TaxID=3346372 RepID=UPI0036F130E2